MLHMVLDNIIQIMDQFGMILISIGLITLTILGGVMVSDNI